MTARAGRRDRHARERRAELRRMGRMTAGARMSVRLWVLGCNLRVTALAGGIARRLRRVRIVAARALRMRGDRALGERVLALVTAAARFDFVFSKCVRRVTRRALLVPFREQRMRFVVVACSCSAGSRSRASRVPRGRSGSCCWPRWIHRRACFRPPRGTARTARGRSPARRAGGGTGCSRRACRRAPPRDGLAASRGSGCSARSWLRIRDRSCGTRCSRRDRAWLRSDSRAARGGSSIRARGRSRTSAGSARRTSGPARGTCRRRCPAARRARRGPRPRGIGASSRARWLIGSGGSDCLRSRTAYLPATTTPPISTAVADEPREPHARAHRGSCA